MVRRLWLALALAGAASAEEPHGAKVFTAPLGPGGASYTISTVNVATTDLGDFFQLVVSDGSGKRVWAGPRLPNERDPLVFGAWHFGVCLPELVADVDGDGVIDLVAPEPQSDVSPTAWRVLRWSGGGFRPARGGTLVERPEGSGRYAWGNAGALPARWINHFQAMSGGRLTAEIAEYDATHARMGQALLSPVPGGYQLVKWLKPLAVVGEDDSKVRYEAEIGPEDLKSSAGKKLTKLHEVLRQDRANVHKFRKRHAGDTVDPYFADAAHREEFDRAKIECATDLEARILRGGVTIDVQVLSDRIAVSARTASNAPR